MILTWSWPLYDVDQQVDSLHKQKSQVIPPPCSGSCLGYQDENLNMVGKQLANGIEPDQTAQMCRLAWFYTGVEG